MISFEFEPRTKHSLATIQQGSISGNGSNVRLSSLCPVEQNLGVTGPGPRGPKRGECRLKLGIGVMVCSKRKEGVGERLDEVCVIVEGTQARDWECALDYGFNTAY
jgi:hypothetical protein